VDDRAGAEHLSNEKQRERERERGERQSEREAERESWRESERARERWRARETGGDGEQGDALTTAHYNSHKRWRARNKHNSKKRGSNREEEKTDSCIFCDDCIFVIDSY
jgi:hypothetical protein